MNEQEQLLLLEIADDELILGWRDSEWTGIAPLLEEDVVFERLQALAHRGETVHV